jgi:hypothetical protein
MWVSYSLYAPLSCNPLKTRNTLLPLLCIPSRHQVSSSLATKVRTELSRGAGLGASHLHKLMLISMTGTHFVLMQPGVTWSPHTPPTMFFCDATFSCKFLKLLVEHMLLLLYGSELSGDIMFKEFTGDVVTFLSSIHNKDSRKNEAIPGQRVCLAAHLVVHVLAAWQRVAYISV